MKAHLMFRDRDFDSRQLLSRREKEWRPNNKSEGLELEQLLPWNEAALRQDLGLDLLIAAMAQRDNFIAEASKVALLSSVSDLDTIQYRQRAFSDCLSNADTVRAIYRLAVEAIEGERKNYWSAMNRYPSAILHRAVDVLQMFVGVLKQLRALADEHRAQFKSEAFSTLFAMLSRELSNGYFTEIEAHLRRLKFRYGVFISARLGTGNKGQDYVLRIPHEDKRNWLIRLFADKQPSYSFQLHPRDEAGAHALSALNDRGLNLVANALAQSTDHILSFFQMLRTELAFYIGCLNLDAELRRRGEPTCTPVPVAMGERKIAFTGLYDAALALSLGKTVVGNDLTADRKNLIVVTGANTGGKSTFLRSLGLAYLMMQAGMFVGANSFSADVCDGLFTHYKREEDASMESGKWDEELSRMSQIVDRVRPQSLVLFNESFASTNEREGSEIARQIVRALMERQVKIAFVTHLYTFAHDLHVNDMKEAIFLRAERQADGGRTFKLHEAEPMETSYGEDLYQTVFLAPDAPALPKSAPYGRDLR